MPKVIAVNGKGGSGKDTFLDYVIEELNSIGFTAYKYSSVDVVKEAAKLLGWDEVKDNKGRQFLSDLKDLSSKNYDGPLNYMMRLVKSEVAPNYMFFHIREPQEIRKFLDLIPDSEAVFIHRDGIEEFDNHADKNVADYAYNYLVDNNSSLDVLKYKAAAYVNYLVFGG